MRSITNDVLVLGGSGVDTIVYVPQLPLPYTDSYLVPAIQTRAGQTGDGVALGLHALGLRVHLVDLIGDDPEGELVRALHQRHGIPFTPVPTWAGTKRAVNLVDPAGRRLSLYDISRGDDDDRLPGEVVRALAGASRHVHVSITNGCQHACPSSPAPARPSPPICTTGTARTRTTKASPWPPTSSSCPPRPCRM